MVKQKGWLRLYAGLTPSLVGTAASQGVYYYFYQTFQNKAEAATLDCWKGGIGDGTVGVFQSLVVAALSGCVNVLLTNPIWVVVRRMQTHKKINKAPPTHALPPDEASHTALIEPPPYGTIHVVQDLYDEARILGFWKGVFPTLIMVSNPTLQFVLYETLLKKLKQKCASNFKGASGLTTLEIFLLGAVAKLGATVVTYPLSVVKSRLQAKQALEVDRKHHYKRTLDVVAKILHYVGITGFYEGRSTKIVQSVFAAAVLFMVKEELVNAVRLMVAMRMVMQMVVGSFIP